MFKIRYRTPRVLGVVLLFGLIAFTGLLVAPATAAEFIQLRSGNGTIGGPDSQINMLVGSGATALSATPFTPADFGAACGGRPAIIINPHPAWLQSLACDPQAQWIGTDPVGTPASALYCQNFNVQTCCIHSAWMTFCWSGDDALGDGIYGGPNLDGVYINGVAVSPSINTGSYAAQTMAGPIDVSALLHCGTNSLQIYNRDAALVVSGIIYRATFDITECSVSEETSTFGAIKSLYR